jgi:hypothetical protein
LSFSKDITQWSLVRVFACAILAVACASAARGQEEGASARLGEQEELETDRDSFTFATSTAAPRKTIVEASYSFIDNRVGPESHSFPELLVRRGLTEGIELRFGWNYEAGGPGTVSGTDVGGEDLQVETEGRLLYGAKFQTSKQVGWLPQSALIVQGFTPTAGPSTNSTVNVGEAFGWTFDNGWTWNSAMRYATGVEKGDAFNQWSPSTVLKIPVGEQWNVHAEYFAIVSSGKLHNLNEHFVSLGAHTMVTPNLELGLRFGFGLNDETPGFFNNVGFGWRF